VLLIYEMLDRWWALFCYLMYVHDFVDWLTDWWYGGLLENFLVKSHVTNEVYWEFAFWSSSTMVGDKFMSLGLRSMELWTYFSGDIYHLMYCSVSICLRWEWTPTSFYALPKTNCWKENDSSFYLTSVF